MIDIHSHILPGLDDGARTLEESLEMLRIAAETGTTDIVATPHADIEYTFDPAAVAQKVLELQASAGGRIRILSGCDLHLRYENIQDALANPVKYSINGRGYLLVEFSDLVIFNSTDEIFRQLRGAGMTPVITHPERNWLLRNRLDRIEGWVNEGAYLQVTAQSILGGFGPEARGFAEELLDKGLCHFIASDAHNADTRPPRLDLAFQHVAGLYDTSYAEALFLTHPRAAIDGVPLDPGPLSVPRKNARKWYQFWK